MATRVLSFAAADHIFNDHPSWLHCPRTGKEYQGPCHRCRSYGCNPAIFVIQYTDGRYRPTCYECLDGGERAEADVLVGSCENNKMGKRDIKQKHADDIERIRACCTICSPLFDDSTLL